MTQKFDLDNIGKRMPYTMPPKTSHEIEANVFSALKQDKRRKKSARIIRWCSVAGIAAAATVTLLLVTTPPATVQDDPLKKIDIAYANLSESDQDFLIDIYQEDIFITQEQ